MDIEQILTRACELRASDIHLSVGAKVAFRVDGDLFFEGNELTPEAADSFARELSSPRDWETLQTQGEADFAYSLENNARFRVNVYRQRGYLSLAARRISLTIPSCEDLGLSSTVKSFTQLSHGLVLITGPTGSGKSTTLAALIQHMNTNQHRHIITLEDPIEYIHSHRKSVIDQREIGVDTNGFASGLRAALRQNPDVILVGEMRDLETIAIAITAAETGHLVFATLHTNDTVKSIDRMIDVFPSEQQGQIRTQLSTALRGVVSQRLYKSQTENRRVAAFEILVNTPAVANLIRSQKIHQIYSVLQTGRTFGMQTMDAHLKYLMSRGVIGEEAMNH